MFENYIVINGKKAELTDEHLEKLGIKIEKENPFKRINGHTYNYIDHNGNIQTDIDTDSRPDNIRYNIANYCTDESLMKQRALHEMLNRLLWRFACENGELGNEWSCENIHWHIYYDVGSGKLGIDFNTYYRTDSIYFPTAELATRAIEEIIKPFMKEHPDFVW